MSEVLESEDASSLAERAYQHILESILTGRLGAGAPVQERRLASEIGLSRSPLRDAFGRLAGEGLLVRSNTGILTVRAISLSDYLHSLDMRTLVEPTAAALAAQSVGKEELHRLQAELVRLDAAEDPSQDDLTTFDDQLHGTVASRSGNAFMERMLLEMRRYTTIYESQTGRRPLPHADGQEHRDILVALSAGIAQDAAEAMGRHLVNIRRRVLDRF